MGVAAWSGSMLELGAVLGRKELRRSLSDFIDGVLSDADRKTGWLLAEQAGLTRPYRMQSLLGRSRWDADAMLAEVRAYVIEALGHADGVLVVDETGFGPPRARGPADRRTCATSGPICSGPSARPAISGRR